MDNPAYVDEEPKVIPEPPPPYHGRIGLEEMEEMRSKLSPDAFCAPLNHGELSTQDMFNVAFLISFPCFFFILGILITAVM